jgi:hypothetical protein
VRPLAHLLLAAADEAAMYVVTHPDPVGARRDILMIIRRLLESLAPAGHRRGFSGRSDGEAQGRG